jgi:hypothetical protein
MRGNLTGGVTSSRHAEPGDLHPAGFMVCLPADVRICRIADVATWHNCALLRIYLTETITGSALVL